MSEKYRGILPTRVFDKGWVKGPTLNAAGNNRNFPPDEYFGDLDIPQTWPGVEAFANWYMSNRMPWMIPWDAEVICSDDATAICVFRHGRFQVELYLVHPEVAVPSHSHPGMDSLIIRLGAGNTGKKHELGVSSIWGAMAPVLRAGEVHGGRPLGFSSKGYAMLTFQHWPEGIEVSSAAVLWKGDTAGPKQDAIVARYLPNVLVRSGFADVTQGKDGEMPTAAAPRAPFAEGNDFIQITDLGGTNG
jgi:hypothetical protein